MVADGQCNVLATLPAGKNKFQFYWRLDEPQGRSVTMWKISTHRDSIPGPSIPYRVASHLFKHYNIDNF